MVIKVRLPVGNYTASYLHRLLNGNHPMVTHIAGKDLSGFVVKGEPI